MTRSVSGVEAHGAVGHLEHHDAGHVGPGVDASSKKTSMKATILASGAAAEAAIAAVRSRDGGEDAAEDLDVEGDLVVEVVVDHRLVDAGAAGDGVHRGAAEAVGGELGDGGVEDVLAGIAGRPGH